MSDDETEEGGVEKERTGNSELAEAHEGGDSFEEIHRCRWWLLYVRVTCMLFSFIFTARH